MAIKSLVEHMTAATEDIENAEVHYSMFPSVLSAIRYVRALENSEILKEAYESIMLDFGDEMPTKKRKKRKSTR